MVATAVSTSTVKAMTGRIFRGRLHWIFSGTCWMANQPSRRPTLSAVSPSIRFWKASWKLALSKRSAALHEGQSFQLKPDVVNGKPGWRLSAAEQTWMIEPQVELGPKDNVVIPVRADFVFYPERSSQALPIAIFTDGFIFHAEGENHRVGYDMAQRMALPRSGRFSIWSLTWDDVEDRFKSPADSAFENFLNHSPAKLGQLLAAQGLNSMLGLHEARNFDILVRFLAQPDHEAWANYAAVNAIALPSTAMVSESAAANIREKQLAGNRTRRVQTAGKACQVTAGLRRKTHRVWRDRRRSLGRRVFSTR